MKTVQRDDVDPETSFSLITDGPESQGYVTEELLAKPNANEWVHHLTDELTYLDSGSPVGRFSSDAATSSRNGP